MGTLAVGVFGSAFYLSLKAGNSSKLPTTISPEWKRATIKYRAAQVQDPISNP